MFLDYGYVCLFEFFFFWFCVLGFMKNWVLVGILCCFVGFGLGFGGFGNGLGDWVICMWELGGWGRGGCGF